MTGGNELAAPADVTLSRREERAEFWFQVAFWCLVIAMVPDVTRKFVDLPALEFIGYLEHAGPVLLTYAAWLTYTGTPSRAPFLTPAYRVWLVLFIAWCAVLTARFFLLERSYRFLLMIDLYPTLAFVAGVVMGGKLVHERLWDRLYMRLLPPGVFMLLAGLAGIRTAVRIEAVTSEGYGMEVLVEPVLFLLLTLDSRFRVREKYLIVGSLVVYALSQVLFQKRAPTARIAVFLLVFTLVCPLLSRQAGLTRAILLRYVVGIGSVLLVILLATLGPGRLAESSRALERRYAESTTDTYRQDEVQLLWKLMTPEERLIGKGFGGHYIGLGLSTSLSYVPGIGADVHASNHIGAFWAIFKGGLVLFVILNLAYLGVVLRVVRALSHPRLFACWFYLVAHIGFQGIETLWGKQQMFHALLVGLCLGHFVTWRSDAARGGTVATAVQTGSA